MDILGFFGSVWLAIFAGIFVLAMIIGCTYDRRDQEAAKWWVFFLGLAVTVAYTWKTGYRPSWDGLLSAEVWRLVGMYLAIGLAYSVLEFALDVRRSVRYWREQWAAYRSRAKGKQDTTASNEDIANSFVARMAGEGASRIIGVIINGEAKGQDDLVVPKVNSTRLAEHIGAWMIFWPFYAVSLIIGDLVMEIARIVADIFAKLSGRFVRMSFANVFRF